MHYSQLSCAVLFLLYVFATASEGTYKAAAAEYSVIYASEDITLFEALEANIDQYLVLMDAGIASEVDILVFPEFGLTPVPKNENRTEIAMLAEVIPSKGNNPCSDAESNVDENGGGSTANLSILQSISCHASKLKLNTMINMVDYVVCGPEDKNCPSDGFYLYNTDVLFDEAGAIAAKYHKSHEWFGLTPQYNVPDEISYETWTYVNHQSNLSPMMIRAMAIISVRSMVVIFPIEWCIAKSGSSSIIPYNKTSIACNM